MKTKISIIVPVYNVEQYLERCINSILSQTYKNIEVILIDDGSTDKSGIICNKYSELDSRVKVLHKENSGQSDCRNIGTDMANGDFIMYVDSDDEIVDVSCEELIKIQSQTDSDLICFKNSVYKNNVLEKYKETKSIRKFNSKEAYIEYLTTNNISCCLWSRFYKAELAKKIKLPIGVLGEDIATTRNYLFESKNIVVYDRYLYKYYMRDDSTMGKKKKSHIINLYDISKDIYDFEIKNFPEYSKIINTKYINNLLKVYANLYIMLESKEKNEYMEKITNIIEAWSMKNKLSNKSKIILLLFKFNKKLTSNMILKFANR